MRFAFSQDQLALAEGVGAVLDDRCPPSVVRSVWNGEQEPAQQLWLRLADIGLLGALVPEADGGLGLTELDIVLCLEESGRAAVPVPLVETAVVAARLLAGSPQAERLPAVVDGELRVSVALDGSGLLPWSGFWNWALVGDGKAVYLVPAPECPVEPVSAVDRARPMAELVGMPVEAWPSADRYLLSDDPRRIALARQSGTLATAAQLIGLAERMLSMTVHYVKQRQQFGVPIGSFQALKHALANALLAVEMARPLVHAAAWAHVQDTTSAGRDVAAAKIRAGEAAGRVARTALQCHGGMGYTQESDLHLWLKRTWALQASWGQPGELRADIARALGIQSLGSGGRND
ncbi:MAG TPA: acyl-CoA dehydrogenase family protein [Kineosporiaceae bacterium]|nr:acyl-CoA dehydrogenase family protein [Kineosporiaceae bacterium]